MKPSRHPVATTHKRQYHVRFLLNKQKKRVEEKVEVEELVYQHDVEKRGRSLWWRGARLR